MRVYCSVDTIPAPRAKSRPILSTLRESCLTRATLHDIWRQFHSVLVVVRAVSATLLLFPFTSPFRGPR